jgi:hypothetical protein
MRISVLLFLACGVLFALQALPATGIYLMFFGGSLLTTLLFFAGMVALFFEAMAARSIWLVAIPISYVSGYYALMITEWALILFVAATLGASQPATGFVFDPQVHALVAPSSSSNELLARYDIEWVYAGADGKRVGIGRTRTCTMISFHASQRNDTTKPLGIKLPDMGKTFCFSYEPAAPPANQVLSFRKDRVKSPLDWPAMRIEKFTVQLGGVDIGSFTEVHTEPLGLLPLLGIGCGLLDQPPTWWCGANFIRSNVTFGGSTADEVAKILGLRHRAPDEIDAMTRLPKS